MVDILKIKLKISNQEHSDKITKKLNLLDEIKEADLNFEDDFDDSYLYGVLSINGERLTSLDFEDPENPDELLIPNIIKLIINSNKQPNEDKFNVLTCTCGDSGCAGFSFKEDIVYKSETVEWIINDPNVVKVFNANKLIFDKNDYLKELERAFDFIKNNKDVYVSDFGSAYKIEKILEYINEKSS